jgi:adenine-specific DNA-methyltransferase
VLIDPPYNRGKHDFRYSDRRFDDPNADDADAAYISNEDGGKHTKWLNQMAPTLVLIHHLMTEQGVILVHCNDIELPRLLLLLEEIFNESNHLGTLVWRGSIDNNPSPIIVEHEYIVCYARDRSKVPSPFQGHVNDLVLIMSAEFNRLKEKYPELADLRRHWQAWIREHKAELPNALRRKTEVDARGPYQPDGDMANPGKEGYRYDVRHPITKKPVKSPLRGWRYPQETMKQLIADDLVVFGKDHTTVPHKKRHLLEDAPERLRSVIEMDNRTAAEDLKKLFPENPAIFKNPKPVDLEEYLLSFVAKKDAIVMDCFAGSGTTGQAVMRLNKLDGGTRRFILIEEGNGDDVYTDSLTAERVKRARVAEKLPGGFTYLRVGRQIDREAFAKFQKVQVMQAILQADASGLAGGIRPINGTYVIGANRRGQAICLAWNGYGDGAVTPDNLAEMFAEAKELGLRKPLRVYGSRCEVFETAGFTFFQLPEELLANLALPISVQG